MIIINLKGGLGNQMFQYAFGRAFSVKNDVEMKLDITNYPRQTLRNYGLGYFNIKESLATPEEVQKIKYPLGIVSKGWRYFNQKILRRFNKDYNPNLLKYRDNYYFDGFFQTEKYFKDIEEIIHREFTLLGAFSPEAEKVASKISEVEIPVSLHIRRGDYVSEPQNKKIHDVCGIEYYQKAIDMISSGFPEAVFFVFSDDIDWAKENIKTSYPIFFVSSPDIRDFEEMHLMSLCKHHIISNSTFSWWGAWLNTDTEKIVIAPKKWTNLTPDDHPNIIPDNWTRI